MSMEQVIEMFRGFGLRGMARVLDDLQLNPAAQSLPREDMLRNMLLAETHDRDDKRVKRLIKTAKFKVQAAAEDIDYRENRSLDREVIGNLLACEWITRAQNALLTGLTGVGKTWMGCAFGMQACRKLIPVRYFRLSRLLESIEIARGDGSLPRLRGQLSRTPLLVLDDWGLTPLTAKGRHDLLELIDDRSGEGSVLITSQLPVDKWYDWLGEPTVADAILDRLVHSAKVSEELLASQAKGVPASTQAPEALLPEAVQILNGLSLTNWGFQLFREHEHFGTLLKQAHRFRATDKDGLFGLAKDIARLTADSFDLTGLLSVAKPANGEQIRSIKALERVIASRLGDEAKARAVCGPLVGIYELRHADAHLPSSDLDEALGLVGVDQAEPFITQGYRMLDSCVRSLYSIVDALASQLSGK